MTSTQPQRPEAAAWARPVAVRSLRVSLALADQAVVSGASFLTSILIGRVCGKPELGVYALGMSIVFMAVAAQQSLISAAHTVFSVRIEGSARRRYNGAVAVQFAALCLLIASCLGCAALGAWVWGRSDTTAPMLLALLFACPCILFREFARRFEFARFNLWGALLLDVGILAIQLLLLAMLARQGLLSGAGGLMAVGAACVLAASFWFWLIRSEFHFAREGLADEFRRGWAFGRWVFGGQLSFAMVGFVIQWVLAGMVDEAAVGVYSACMMLILLANPLIIGLQNMLSPSIAKAVHDGGRHGVCRLVGRSTIGLTLLMTPCVAVILFWGDGIVTWVYGQAFAGNQWTIGLLGAGLLATSIGVSSNHGLRAIERTELNFWAALLGLLCGVATASLAIPTWGVVGAALGYAVSCGLTAGVRIVGFLVVSRQVGEAFG